MLTFTATSGEALYRQTVFSLLSALEGSTRRAYLDTAADPAPTIGLGFNLRYNLEPVLKAMLGAGWDPSLQARLKAVVEKSYGRGETALLNSRLDAVMAEWNATRDPGVPRTFGFSSDAQIGKVLVAIAPLYEAMIDRWLAGIPQSTERAVLFSLAWNGPSLLGPKLKAAILAGDRAEAWYEIRYNSNGRGHDGIANRRYVEAERFKLFALDNTASETEALDAARMFTLHRQKVLAYEEAHDPEAASRLKGVESVDGIYRELAPAITRLKAAYGIPEAMALEEVLIVSGSSRSLSGDDGTFDFAGNDADLLIGSARADTLSGNRGNDALVGLAGNDRLIGGAGADFLVGGAGADVFVFRSAAEIGKRVGARDTIADFEHGRDRIDLSAIDANGKAPGQPDFTLLSAKGTAFGGKAGELRWYHASEKGKPVTVVEGDIDGDGRADFSLALAGRLLLDRGDFIL